MSDDVVHATDEVSLEASLLPNCLTLRPDGSIVITGHRVTLFAILEAANDLKHRQLPVAAAQLKSVFPTIDQATIAEVMRFVSDNAAKVQQYFDSRSRDAANNLRRFASSGPDLEALRQKQRDVMR